MSFKPNTKECKACAMVKVDEDTILALPTSDSLTAYCCVTVFYGTAEESTGGGVLDVCRAARAVWQS